MPAVAAGDVLGGDLLRRRLGWMAQDRTLTGEAEAARRALDAWEKHHQATYTRYVGSWLGDRVRAVGDELRGHLAALAEATSEPDELFRAQQRWQELLSRIVVGIAGAALAVVALTGLMMALVLGASAGAVLTLVGAVLGGAVGTSLAYGIGQRRLFRELRHRRALIERMEAEQPNLRRVLREYRRLRDAYSEFLLWSRTVAAVLEEPFGRVGAERAGFRLPTLRELPPSVRIGHAVVDPEVLPGAVATLRGDLFVTGWLTGPWRSNLDLAARRFAAGAHAPPGSPAKPEALLGTRSSSSADPPLRAWSRQLVVDGPAPEIGHQTWSAVLASLTGPRADIGEALLPTIQPRDGRGGTQALADFLAGVDRPSDAVDHWFDAAHFTALAQTDERARVSGSMPSGSRNGLSRVDVLVQFGEAFPAWDLELGSEDPEADAAPGTTDEPSF